MSRTADSWTRVWDVFHDALARPADARSTFLDDACAADPALRHEAESLLQAHEQAADFLESPAAMEPGRGAPNRESRPPRAMVGRSIGAYQIDSEIAAGGMGVVFLAHDVRLGRRVAIKALPPLLGREPTVLARFKREARLLASLSHPNVATVYGLEEEADGYFIVMEYVEGETLADRLARGALPIDEALEVCAQIGAGLEAAHEAGVIHRDLKPANVGLTSDGRVVVLDFGLARHVAADVEPRDHPITESGLFLGTPGYLSPEQARGRTIDRRTDVFSFGCVLYACLTGRMAFPGDSVGDCIAALLEREPDWTALPARTPARVRDLLERCLEKDPSFRLRHLGDARLEIERALRRREWTQRSRADRPVATSMRRLGFAFAVVAPLALAVALLAGSGWAPWRRDAATYRFTLAPPTGASFVALGANIGGSAISPDGLHVAFVATESEASRLWIRPMNSLMARALDGTEGAFYPFWSPDSRQVAFFASGKLKRVSVAGGMPQVIAEAPLGRGGSWSRDGTILFTPNARNVVHRVAADGGPAEPVTARDGSRAELSHSFPQWLPDGRHFIYLARSEDSDLSGVYVTSLRSPAARRLLLATNFNAVVARQVDGRSTGLIYVHDGRLAVRAFDPVRRTLGDDVSILAESVEYVGNIGLVHLSASETGAILYARSGAVGTRLRWVTRSGQTMGFVGRPDNYIGMQLSPDERRVAVSRVDPRPGTPDVWVIDVENGRETQVTFDRALDFHAVWSPDGGRLAFGSQRAGLANIFLQPANGAGAIDAPLPADRFRQPLDWTPDGRHIVYQERDTLDSEEDLWALAIGGDRRPIRLTETPYEESHAQVSPDGRLLAYRSDEGLHGQVVVQPFLRPGRTVRISPNGGTQPRWSGNGRELFYLAADGWIVAVDIRVVDGAIMAGAPRPLFDARTVSSARYEFTYDVSADGRRFLVLTRDEARAAEQMEVRFWLRK